MSNTVAEKEIAWWMPQLTGAEYAEVKAVLDSNYLNDGRVTTKLEEQFASLLGVKHALCVTSGTAAIFLGLKAAGVKAGDEVIVPDMTFIATANAAEMTGATVVLVDIDPRTLNIDPAAFERAITPRTKAVVPVHVSGRGADMKAIMEIANRRGIAVVEDAAEGFLSKKDGQFLGTIGASGAFSFSPNKTITTGQGGLIVTNDDDLRRRLRELKDQGRPVQGTGGDDIHHSVGYNFKMTNLQSAVGLGQLPALHGRMETARRIYRIYRQRLDGLDGLAFPGFDVDNGETPQWTDVIVDRRDELDRYLAEHGAHCRRFWHPIHTQAPYRRPDEEFPNATRVGPKALWLPSNFNMTDDDVHRVCDLIRECLAG